MYAAKLSRITAKLDRLRILDSRLSVPGADEHEYKLNERIDIKDVAKLEKKHRIKLPAEYRHFITHFANGGAGPIYGIVPLKEAFEKHLKPHLPFPYATGRKVPYADDQTGEELEKLCAFYEDPKNNHGKLVIGEQGCGIMFNLIITGKARGQVWIDDRTTEWGGFYPDDQFGNNKPLPFMGWYEAWLDDSLSLFEEEA